MSTTDFFIRQATLDDLAEIKACAAAAFSPFIEKVGKPPAPMLDDQAAEIQRGVVFVGLRAGRFVGYVVYQPKGENMHLETLAVLPSRMRKGYGTRLVAHVEQVAKDNELSAISLCTHVTMTENFAFYKNLGFLETGRGKQDGYDRVFFKKSL
jgi:ribosomal protein S18 acetylase RimI-like enzyme